MNEKKFEEKMQKIINNSTQNLLNIVLEKGFENTVKKQFQKNLTKLFFILIKSNILINFLEQIKENMEKYLTRKDIKKFDEFYKNVISADYYLYKLFENFEKIANY